MQMSHLFVDQFFDQLCECVPFVQSKVITLQNQLTNRDEVDVICELIAIILNGPNFM